MSRQLSRRELAGLVGISALACRAGASPARALPRHPGRVGLATVGTAGGRPEARAAMEAALGAAVPGKSSGAEAVGTLFSSSDTVGIKLNCLAGPRLSPSVELVEALVELLVEAGVQRRRIIVFERSSKELERAGYSIRRQAGPYLCHGTDNDYDPLPSESGAIGSCFARLVSTTCSALISFGVVKDHDLAGVSAGLKNWYGVIHNPNKYHDNNCDPYVADVVRHPFLSSKIRLTVLDGGIAQCEGGPAYLHGGTWPLGMVAASTDPVAVDVWAWRVIEAERKRRGLPTLTAENRAPRFLATAAAYGLGVAEGSEIEEIRA